MAVKNICRETQSFVKTGQKFGVLCIKDQVRFIVAGDINLPLKLFCMTLNVVIFLTVTCNPAIDTEGILKFSLKQWLRERNTMLQYMYIARLFFLNIEWHFISTALPPTALNV